MFFRARSLISAKYILYIYLDKYTHTHARARTYNTSHRENERTQSTPPAALTCVAFTTRESS